MACAAGASSERENQRPIAVELPEPSETTLVVSVLAAQLAADGGGAGGALEAVVVRGPGAGLGSTGGADGAGALSPVSEPNQRPTAVPPLDDVVRFARWRRETMGL